MPIDLEATESDLAHTLTPHFEAIKRFNTLSDLRASALYRDIGPEIERLTGGLAWRNTVRTDRAPEIIRAVAWNIERGLRLDGVIHLLRTHEVLSKADILFITEADIGMGRTENRNVPRELSDALGMNYLFANAFLSLEKGDIGERQHTRPNTLALHGIALLSRFPIRSYDLIHLPNFKDLFDDLEKRLGSRKGLICTIPIGERTLAFALTHLELAISPRQRALQIAPLLDALAASRADGVLLGGDFNTTTYDLRGKHTLFKDLAHRAFFLGVRNTIAHYLRPDQRFEKPLFDRLAHDGYAIAPFNDRTRGTVFYDVNDANFNAKIRQYHVPRFALKRLRRSLAPWQGRVPMRLDWFAGRNLRPIRKPRGDYGPPRVIDTPRWHGAPISDHSPIVVDIHL